MDAEGYHKTGGKNGILGKGLFVRFTHIGSFKHRVEGGIAISCADHIVGGQGGPIGKGYPCGFAVRDHNLLNITLVPDDPTLFFDESGNILGDVQRTPNRIACTLERLLG
ncbi:hypothetical protein SDC9_45918 [bioreactor metagenome]|uniref:Uncharacterized protein n=1 Tax=bioreactor metagenome TaxID=1076179 RepID=A0A644W834_9ZZZZ